MTSRRSRVAAAAVLLGLVVLAVIGRAEAAHRGRVQSRGIARVAAEIGGLDTPALDSYRKFSGDVWCLIYRVGRDPFSLELCVDREGRAVEAIDRRTAPEPRIWSLRDDRSRSTVRLDRAAVYHLLRELGVKEALPGPSS